MAFEELFKQKYKGAKLDRKALVSATVLLISSFFAHTVVANETLENQVDELQKQLAEMQGQMDAMADSLESSAGANEKDSRLHIGGYGEMHYNAIENDDEKIREVDFHRFVVFLGYEFTDSIRLVSELEVEHVIASAGNRGAVELEQAYIEFDLSSKDQVQAGLMLMPIGIINETHEPPTFYGVERPVVETTVIPTTWYVNALKYVHRFDSAVQLDFMVSEGLKTEDPNSDINAEPFNIKKGKQKGSFAAAYDFAYTGRVAYTGIAGLNLSAYVQHQTDIDQSAEESYADAATLVGGHIIYNFGRWQARALVAQWLLDGDPAEDAGKEAQFGAYGELSWKPVDTWGIFARHSVWSLEKDVDAQQTDIGVNYWPIPDVVLKMDAQFQNEDAGEFNGINLGIGYQF